MGTGSITKRGTGGVFRETAIKGMEFHKQVYFTITMSTSYAAGGDTIAFPTELKTILDVFIMPKNGYSFVPDIAAGKVLAYSTAATEVVATTNLSTACGAISAMAIGY